MFLADILCLWRKCCTIVHIITFGIALHIGLLRAQALVAAVASVPPRPLYLDDTSKLVSIEGWGGGCMSAFFSARHQTRPAQQLQVGILIRLTNFTRWWQFASTAGDRGCRFLTTQRRKGEVVIFRWILCAMRPLNLLQVLIKPRTCWCHRRCGNDDVWHSANYRILLATAFDFSQLQVQLINQTDNVWFLMHRTGEGKSKMLVRVVIIHE